MAELLLELLSEEIPARLQRRAADDLGRLLGAALKEADLAFEQVSTYATPRRLALVMRGLAAKQPDVQVEKRGPRVGAPAEALSGFLASLGVADYRLEEQDDKRGPVHVARYPRIGRSAADVLVPVLGEILARFPWPKSMRWGAHAIRWVRPLHGILCLLDGEVVPVRFGPLEATAGDAGASLPRTRADRGARFRGLSAAADRRLRPARCRRSPEGDRERSGPPRARREPASAQRFRACSTSSRAWSSGRSCCPVGSTSGSWRCPRRCW